MSLSHHMLPLPGSPPRHDWTREEVRELFALPFPELIFRAAQVHREYFDPSEVQISTLLSIKDRRVSGRLCLLPAVGEIRDRCES